MRSSAVLPLSLCFLAFTTSFGAADSGDRSVVVARLIHAPLHNRQDYERDRALYVHENLQPLVFDVERTLLGSATSQRIIVFIQPERSSRFAVEWIGSYGLLSQSEWSPGQEFILVLAARDKYGDACDLFAPKSGDQYLLDPGLNDYKGLSGFCASLGDVYPLGRAK